MPYRAGKPDESRRVVRFQRLATPFEKRTSSATCRREEAIMSSARALLCSAPDPATDYAAAEAKFAALHALDSDAVQDICRSTLLAHGRRMPHAYILLHGLSNCPRQYVQFAPLLFARGANVLVPRLPLH